MALLAVVIIGILLSSWHAQYVEVRDGTDWFHVGEVIVGGLLVALTYLAVNRQARQNYAVALRTRELNDALRALEQDMAKRQQDASVRRTVAEDLSDESCQSQGPRWLKVFVSYCLTKPVHCLAMENRA